MATDAGRNKGQMRCISSIMLVLVLFQMQPAIARKADPSMRALRTLDSSFPACSISSTSRQEDCILCPAGYKSVNGDKPMCTNIFGTPPVIGVGSINTTDLNLCQDWVGSAATLLGPMYDGGDCSKARMGELYALYDCSSKKVCFKATSCVGSSTTAGPRSPPNPGNTAYKCPGVGCGCESTTQASSECYPVDNTPNDNWFYLADTCGAKNDPKTRTGIFVGYTHPADSKGMSGWEWCLPAAENKVYTVQAHFDVSGDTVDNQMPNSYPYGLQLKTPICTPTCGNVKKPANCAASNTVSTPLTCTLGSTVNIFPRYCYVSTTSYTFRTTGTALTVNSTGGFTCPDSGRSAQVTVTAREGAQDCYTFLVDVVSIASAPVPCGVVAVSQAPNVCPADSQATATFSVSAQASTIIKTCPDGTSTSSAAPVNPSSEQQVTLSCARPSNGWSNAVFKVEVTGDGCITASSQTQANLLPQSIVTITAADMPNPAPAICFGSPTAAANFKVSQSDHAAQLTYTYEVEPGCQQSLSSGLVAVSCTSSSTAGYIAGPVSITLHASATSATSCPTTGILTQSVLVEPPPVLRMGTTGATLCSSQTNLTTKFNFSASENMTPLSSCQFDVKAKTAAGTDAVGVVCTPGPVIDSTITVQCALETNKPLSTLSSPTDLAAVQLTVYEVAGLGACTQPATPSTRVYSASATITPLPRLRMAARGATICSSKTQATVDFSFAASEDMAPLNESQFTVKARTAAGTDAAGVVCSVGSIVNQAITVNCARADNEPFLSLNSPSDFASVQLVVNYVTGVAECSQKFIPETQAYSAGISITPKPHLVVQATDARVCNSQTYATVMFNLSASESTALLHADQFTVQAKTATGNDAVDVVCTTGLIQDQVMTVHCGLADGQALSQLTTPTDFASVHLTIRSITGVSACSQTFSPGSQLHIANVTIMPQPRLSIAAAVATVCEAELQVAVSFDFSASQDMKALSLSQFLVQPKTAAGAYAAGVVCNPKQDIVNQTITVLCELTANQPLFSLSNPGDFNSVQLTVNEVTGLGACPQSFTPTQQVYSATVVVAPRPRLNVVATDATVCSSASRVVVKFDLSGSEHMAPLLGSQFTVHAKTVAGADATEVTCTSDVVDDNIITVQCGLNNGQPLSTLTSTGKLASVQLLVNKVSGLGACGQEITPTTQAYSANVAIAPEPRLSIVATDAMVCSSHTQAMVTFNFSSSQYMGPLSLDDVTVKPKTAAGTDATEIVCTPGLIGDKVIKVHCGLAGQQPLSQLSTSTGFVSVQLTVNKVAGLAPCAPIFILPTTVYSAGVTIVSQPSLSIQTTGDTVCCSETQARVRFDFSTSQFMAPLSNSQFTVKAKTAAGADAAGVLCTSDPVVGQVINVQCGLLDYRPFVTLPSPSEFAGVQLTVHEIAGAGACTTTVASATQTYNASVVVAPQPVLSIVASDTTVCSSETQAIVKFDFRTSEYMAPLTLSQFTVVAKTSIGTTAARVLCTPDAIMDQVITVHCKLAGNQPMFSLSSHNDFASVHLTVHQIRDIAGCSHNIECGAKVYSAAVTVQPQPRLSMEAANVQVCSSDTHARVKFDFSASEHMAPITEEQVTLKAKTAAGTDSAEIVCSPETIQDQVITVLCGLADNQPFSTLNLQNDFASVQLTVKEVTGVSVCSGSLFPLTPSAQVYSASITSLPQPQLNIVATDASVCSSETQVMVKFDFSTSQNTGPLTASQLTVQAKTAAGASATGVICTLGPVVDQAVTVHCGLSSIQPLSHLSSPSDFASVQLTVTGLTSAAGCSQTVSPTSGIQAYSANVLISPKPVLSIAATDAAVCNSATEATVKFDFSASNHMVPLTESQFTVKAKTSTGTDTTGVVCTTGPVADQAIIVRCGLAGNQLLSSLVSPSHFAGVQLIVKEITGLGHCSPGVTLDTQAYTANVRIAPQPRLSMSATGATVCSSETSATVKFNYSSSENMAQLSASQLTVQAKTAAGAIAPGIVCTTGWVENQEIAVQCGLPGGQPFSLLSSPADFASVQLTVIQITGLGGCGLSITPVAQTYSASVSIDPQPALTIAPADAPTASIQTICSSETQATVKFNFSTSTNMPTLSSNQFIAQAKTAAGMDATGVLCVPGTIVDQIITVQCGLPDNQPLSSLSSPSEFASVQLTVVQNIPGVGACAAQSFAPGVQTYSAGIVIAPKPKLSIVAVGAILCSSDSAATVKFNYSTSENIVPLVASQIAVKPKAAVGTDAVGVTCTHSVASEDKVIAVQCSRTVGPGDFVSVQLSVDSVMGIGVCAGASFSSEGPFIAPVTIIPRATLSMPNPADTTICYGANPVHAVFGFTVNAQTSLSFKVTAPAGSTQTENPMTRTVVVSSPAPTDAPATAMPVPVALQGFAGSTAPCPDASTTALTTVYVDAKPTATLALKPGQPKPTCINEPLQAVFDYSLSSNIGGSAQLVATSAGASCTISGGPPATLSEATISGSLTVSCTGGAWSVGSKPVVQLQMSVNKAGCSYKEIVTAAAAFQPLLCCKSGTSYAAFVDTKGIRRQCFASKASTCIYTEDPDENINKNKTTTMAYSVKGISKKVEKSNVKDSDCVGHWGFYVEHRLMDTPCEDCDDDQCDSKDDRAGDNKDDGNKGTTKLGQNDDGDENDEVKSNRSKQKDQETFRSKVQLILAPSEGCLTDKSKDAFKDYCSKGTVVGDANLVCAANKAGRPESLTITVNNLANTLLTEQHYYIGCKSVRTCYPPLFGATSVAKNCALGLAETCGGDFPDDSVEAFTDNGMRTQAFTISVDPKKWQNTKCLSCKDVVWVVQQKGTYKAGNSGAGSQFTHCTA